MIAISGGMDMRYCCKFRFEKDNFITWFVEQLKTRCPEAEVSVSQTKYETRLLLEAEQEQIEYSIIKDSNKKNCYIMKSLPKLTFWKALFRQKDTAREHGVKLADHILVESGDVGSLGWYLGSQMWKGPTPTPE